MPRSGKDLIGLYEFVAYVRWFEVCKTSKLPARRRVYSFCFCKRTKKHAQRAFSVGGGAPTPRILSCFFKSRWNVPEREPFYVLFASTKRTGSSRRAAALSTPGERFKTLQNSFFMTFPPFVPKLVCGATHFFGCFEPVRKGYCSADARPLFFGNGLPHCKLTEASHIQKG